MAHPRRSLIGLLSFCLLATAVVAQIHPPGGPGSSPHKKEATFKVMALSDSVPVEGLYYLKNAKEGVALNLPSGRFSTQLPPFSLTQPLTFGVKGPLVEGMPSFRPLAQANWPEGGAEEVAVFIAAAGEGAGMRLNAIAIENGLVAFPPRSLRVLNFSGQKLFAQIGSFRSDLPPGPARAIPYPEVKAELGRTGRFRVGLGRMDAEGRPEILFSGWTDAWPNARTLILVTIPRPDSRKPEVRFLVDSLPPPAVPKPEPSR